MTRLQKPSCESTSPMLPKPAQAWLMWQHGWGLPGDLLCTMVPPYLVCGSIGHKLSCIHALINGPTVMGILKEVGCSNGRCGWCMSCCSVVSCREKWMTNDTSAEAFM